MGKYGSSAFDCKITIERHEPQLDELGKPKSGGAVVTTVCAPWARYEPVSDREQLTHQHVVAITARFTIRWSQKASGIKSTDKLKFRGQTFAIVGVPKEIGRRQYIEITAGAHEA